MNLFYSFKPQKSKMGLKVSAGLLPFRKLQGRIPFLVLSSFYRLPVFLGLWPPSSIFKASNSWWISYISFFL